MIRTLAPVLALAVIVTVAVMFVLWFTYGGSSAVKIIDIGEGVFATSSNTLCINDLTPGKKYYVGTVTVKKTVIVELSTSKYMYPGTLIICRVDGKCVRSSAGMAMLRSGTYRIYIVPSSLSVCVTFKR